jgi:branched-subunit amino acid aminotransferase/4-amino-4-deoxychorismate lyase
MPSKLYAYVNGKFVPETEARVGIFDRGFLYGHGCFETMRVYEGRIFRAAGHLKRLTDGLNRLGIEMILTAEELHAACRALIRYNAISSGVARIYQTPDSIVVTVQSRQFEPRQLRAMVSSVRVDTQLSGIKSANRLPYIFADREAHSEGVDDAVLLNAAGNVVEFTTSNLFVVKDGEVFTPPLSDGPLPGITRAAICELTRVTEKSFTPEFLEMADEVCATNSLLEIAPVTTWSHRRDVTARLQSAYRELVRGELGLS